MTELQLTPNDLRNFAKLAEQQNSPHVTVRPTRAEAPNGDVIEGLTIALADNTPVLRSGHFTKLDTTLPAHLR